MTKEKTLLSAFLLMIGLSLSGFFIGHALSTMKESDRYVTVKGLAEKIVKADKSIWNIKFNYGSDDLKDLYVGIAKSQQQVKDFFIKQGFNAGEIETHTVSVTDNQSRRYGGGDAKVKRYIAYAGLVLTTTDVDKVRLASQKTGDLVQVGIILTESNVKYRFTQLNDIKPGMLDAATVNAKQAAESFAKNSHNKLGTIRHANQGLFSIQGSTGGYDSDKSIMKKVRVVSTVQYYLG